MATDLLMPLRVIPVRNRTLTLVLLLMFGMGVSRASVALFLEEPFGSFGGMTPTGHARSLSFTRLCGFSHLLTALQRG